GKGRNEQVVPTINDKSKLKLCITFCDKLSSSDLNAIQLLLDEVELYEIKGSHNRGMDGPTGSSPAIHSSMSDSTIQQTASGRFAPVVIGNEKTHEWRSEDEKGDLVEKTEQGKVVLYFL